MNKNKRISRKLESKLAESVRGKTQPGSGCSRVSSYKGDVRILGEWRIEHKFTNSTRSWTLKVDDLEKIGKHAMEAGEIPALVVEFPRLERSYAIIPLSKFLEVVNEHNDN